MTGSDYAQAFHRRLSAVSAMEVSTQTEGVTRKTRQTARVWLDAVTVRRMRRDLADGVRMSGEEALPFGDG